jgi:hypothetical protein
MEELKNVVTARKRNAKKNIVNASTWVYPAMNYANVRGVRMAITLTRVTSIKKS